MAITIDNKTYRNLEEQVLKNKEDIARHYEVDRVLADWGIKVIGVVDSVDNIPEADYEYGDAFGLSSTDPMQYVIWTRANANVGQENDYWLNIGSLTIVGPTGPQGNIGPTGPQGERGSYWFSGSTTPTASTAYKANDHFLNTNTGDVYIYTSNSTWTLQGNIRGRQGNRGLVGPQGARGPQGPIGPQGPKGDTGASFQIGGLLESADLLPTPTEANRYIGYAVKNADGVTYDLYVVVGTDTLMWVNMGRVEGVEGPQGPIGPQGPAGADIQVVYITGIPETSTQGTLTQDQVNTLLAHPSNYIQFFNENFYPQDVETDEGYIVYSHVGLYEGNTIVKTITLTLATLSWVLTTINVGEAEPPITIVNTLPTANEGNFVKGKIYTTGEVLKYISKVALTEPTINQIASLPFSTQYGSATKVENVIYIAHDTEIYRYDINTNIYTLLPIELTSSVDGGVLVYYNNYLYAINSSIQKINLNTNSVETLTATIGWEQTAYCVVDNKVYGFGGYNSKGARVFNLETETTSTMTNIDDIRAGAVAVNGRNGYIYIFGGWNGAYKVVRGTLKWSIANSNYTKLSSINGYANYRIPFYTSDKIYLIGGTTNEDSSYGTINRIDVFDVTTETLETISTTLEVSFGAYAQGTDKVYIFGGSTADSPSNYQSQTFGFGFEYSYKTITSE